jgi:undecaprenyl diphosphate synthase
LPRSDLATKILENGNVPKHVAIIMDGNGRWAKMRGQPRSAGHKAGVETVKTIVKASARVDVEILTLFTFSVENWKRPKAEVSAIMKLLYDKTRSELDELLENNVRLTAMGHIEGLPVTRRNALKHAIKMTSKNDGLVLNLALNYGGRTEILDAVRKIAKDVKQGRVNPAKIDETMFSTYLYTNGHPDPDLLIRTSGEKRLSNFLLWQTSYTELYVTDTLWPDFTEDDFFKAILDYQARERRFGELSRS